MEEPAGGLAHAMSDLGEYLKSCGHKRRIDGQHDCATFPANWVLESRGFDPMKKWRGTYNGEESALQLIEHSGGLVALFDEGLRAHGISRQHADPKAGDIGIVRIQDTHAGAIFTGKRWAIVVERGIGFCSLSADDIEAVWAVNG